MHGGLKGQQCIVKPQLSNTDNSLHYLYVPSTFVHDCSYATLSRGIPWNFPRTRYAHEPCIKVREYTTWENTSDSWDVPWYITRRRCNNYFIRCHRKYSDQHNQWDIRAVHDGKVGCNTVEYIQRLLCVLIACDLNCMVYKVYGHYGIFYTRLWLQNLKIFTKWLQKSWMSPPKLFTLYLEA